VTRCLFPAGMLSWGIGASVTRLIVSLPCMHSEGIVVQTRSIDDFPWEFGMRRHNKVRILIA
jgi:hypothetical protein